MTPYEIRLLIHYTVIAEDHKDFSTRPSVFAPTIAQFIRQGLLRENPMVTPECPTHYLPTERGRLYVDALCMVPLPELMWCQEWPADPIFRKAEDPV